MTDNVITLYPTKVFNQPQNLGGTHPCQGCKVWDDEIDAHHFVVWLTARERDGWHYEVQERSPGCWCVYVTADDGMFVGYV